MTKEYNFDEFAKTSKSQWIEKLNQDLGADVATRILTWNFERELSGSAYYDDSDATAGLKIPSPIHTSWKYLQAINAKQRNEEVMDALMNGADGLLLEGPTTDVLDKLLSQVAPEHCTIGLSTKDTERYEKMVDWLDKHLESTTTTEFLLFHEDDENSSIQHGVSDFESKAFKTGLNYQHRTLNINSSTIQRSGGGARLELAYLLANGVYRINNFLDQGYAIEDICNSIFVSTSVGSNFFLELSKVRVMRMLMNKVFEAYELSQGNVPIHATTSSLTKSGLDRNTNFLRCTSEAMSAVLGGADYLTIDPHHDLKSADRIARNISNLLKEESHLAKTIDPSRGSYYVEKLSKTLANESWQMFQEIEKNGGFEVALDNGFFESELKKDWEFQQSRIASGKRKVVGVNDFGNQDEILDVESMAKQSISLSKDFEDVRKSVEAYVNQQGEEQRPMVYLLAVGSDAKMANARFTFVTNFFTWSGLHVKKLDPTEKINTNSVIVCCGADADYTDEAVKMAVQATGTERFILAAGKENQAASGLISGWLNMKTNRLKGVQDVLDQMGVTNKLSKS